MLHFNRKRQAEEDLTESRLNCKRARTEYTWSPIGIFTRIKDTVLSWFSSSNSTATNACSNHHGEGMSTSSAAETYDDVDDYRNWRFLVNRKDSAPDRVLPSSDRNDTRPRSSFSYRNELAATRDERKEWKPSHSVSFSPSTGSSSMEITLPTIEPSAFSYKDKLVESKLQRQEWNESRRAYVNRVPNGKPVTGMSIRSGRYGNEEEEDSEDDGVVIVRDIGNEQTHSATPPSHLPTRGRSSLFSRKTMVPQPTVRTCSFGETLDQSAPPSRPSETQGRSPPKWLDASRSYEEYSKLLNDYNVSSTLARSQASQRRLQDFPYASSFALAAECSFGMGKTETTRFAKNRGIGSTNGERTSFFDPETIGPGNAAFGLKRDDVSGSWKRDDVSGGWGRSINEGSLPEIDLTDSGTQTLTVPPRRRSRAGEKSTQDSSTLVDLTRDEDYESISISQSISIGHDDSIRRADRPSTSAQHRALDRSDIHRLSTALSGLDVQSIHRDSSSYQLRSRTHDDRISKLTAQCEEKYSERIEGYSQALRKIWVPRAYLKEIEIERESPDFRALTPKELSLLESAWSNAGYPEEVLVEEFRIPIKRRDLQTLRSLNWLNDEVINFYLNLLTTRPGVYTFNSFLYPKLMESGHGGVKRWTRKVDLFSFDILLIPVHLQVHWCMAVSSKRSTGGYPPTYPSACFSTPS